MREDCKIDNRTIVCNNAATLAGRGYKLETGMCFTYEEAGQTRLARSIGRVTAPALAGCTAIDGYVLAMVLSFDANHTYERWVNPDDVIEIFNAPTKLAAFFFAPSLPCTGQTMRKLMEHGTISERYIDNLPQRLPEMMKR